MCIRCAMSSLSRRELLATPRPGDREIAPAEAEHPYANLLLQRGKLLGELAVRLRGRLPACRRRPLLLIVKGVDVGL
eukprot:3349867-Pleurochrysis_carterae.AAC.1